MIGAPAALASSPSTGGAGLDAKAPKSAPVDPTVPGMTAKIIHGIAYAPSFAPIQVQRAIWAGDKIDHDPYIWGGGHADFASRGYDCSGSVSYVLHAAGLLSSPEDSSALMSYGAPGPGQYVTIYASPGHAWMTIDGRRYDTVALAEDGTRWSDSMAPTGGFVVRHPDGL